MKPRLFIGWSALAAFGLIVALAPAAQALPAVQGTLALQVDSATRGLSGSSRRSARPLPRPWRPYPATGRFSPPTAGPASK